MSSHERENTPHDTLGVLQRNLPAGERIGTISNVGDLLIGVMQTLRDEGFIEARFLVEYSLTDDGTAAYIDAALARAVATARPYTKARIPAGLRTKVFERDEYRCVDCGTHLNLQADHIFPEAKGGETTLENLATRCRSCNQRKGTRLP